MVMAAASQRSDGFPKVVAAVAGLMFLTLGVWAMANPSSFYESIALFDPYNPHFIQNLGAFQIGLGATLALAAFFTSDALAAGLVGVGLGATAHVVSHLMSLDTGGRPLLEVSGGILLALLLLVAGVVRWRTVGPHH